MCLHHRRTAILAVFIHIMTHYAGFLHLAMAIHIVVIVRCIGMAIVRLLHSGMGGAAKGDPDEWREGIAGGVVHGDAAAASGGNPGLMTVGSRRRSRWSVGNDPAACKFILTWLLRDGTSNSEDSWFGALQRLLSHFDCILKHSRAI